MPRSKNKVASRARRKKMLEYAKGYWGARSKVWTIAKHHIEKGWQYAYRDRRAKKREFRRLWITRINAAARAHGMSYSRFMHLLSQKEIQLDRKMLADLAMNQPEAFAAIVEKAQS
ncbi:MAG: 50S ribosomal protein L20 [Bacteroidota bacterium]|nr:50S ribosomal protein L20 [Candidatus Kapabacteria bacterium]MDW8220151.1 50S ribosomal protein L20 [Bacteroidota bacterium]